MVLFVTGSCNALRRGLTDTQHETTSAHIENLYTITQNPHYLRAFVYICLNARPPGVVFYCFSLFVGTSNPKQKRGRSPETLYIKLLPLYQRYCFNVCFGHLVIMIRANMGFA